MVSTALEVFDFMSVNPKNMMKRNSVSDDGTILFLKIFVNFGHRTNSAGRRDFKIMNCVNVVKV